MTEEFSFTAILEYIRKRYKLKNFKSIMLEVMNGKGPDRGKIFSNSENIKDIY